MPTLYSVAVFVTDMEKAKQFYRDHLELPLLREGSFGAEFLDGPTRLGVHPAVPPDARAMVGRHTGFTLHVDGILAKGRGSAQIQARWPDELHPRRRECQ